MYYIRGTPKLKDSYVIQELLASLGIIVTGEKGPKLYANFSKEGREMSNLYYPKMLSGKEDASVFTT